jgi:hypothetical protein
VTARITGVFGDAESADFALKELSDNGFRFTTVGMAIPPAGDMAHTADWHIEATGSLSPLSGVPRVNLRPVLEMQLEMPLALAKQYADQVHGGKVLVSIDAEDGPKDYARRLRELGKRGVEDLAIAVLPGTPPTGPWHDDQGNPGAPGGGSKGELSAGSLAGQGSQGAGGSEGGNSERPLWQKLV